MSTPALIWRMRMPIFSNSITFRGYSLQKESIDMDFTAKKSDEIHPWCDICETSFENLGWNDSRAVEKKKTRLSINPSMPPPWSASATAAPSGAAAAAAAAAASGTGGGRTAAPRTFPSSSPSGATIPTSVWYVKSVYDRPRTPNFPSPQLYTSPSSVATSVCLHPQLTFDTHSSSSPPRTTCSGSTCGRRSPNPSCPQNPSPHV
ncbi:hypothetical protein ACHAW5_005575 [Stephanodiscus triporus]|uniref:Uncharacterized protein n=1 Tax=Stephanodiscus triporus TaxID=2934178 RepID=A0ABD3NPX8_9STRA